jgi:glycosyltransferase involved in cell wall biosynthesis
MATFHILTQYIWPDAAPTGLYAEQLALRLQGEGCEVFLIGGNGEYRSSRREKPPILIRHLEHYRGRRGRVAESLREYASISRAFERYIDERVEEGDIVICTSAPPNTVRLAPSIKRRRACAVYWLQDYYPELVRGVHDYPRPLRTAFRKWWDRRLAQWDRVVKIGGNLGGDLPNAIVIRNWPTMSLERDFQSKPRTALYVGNLGYGHDVDLLIRGCARLRDEGYTIDMYADGPGTHFLPSWLKVRETLKGANELRAALLNHEVHLIAAHPKIRQAIFPSKIWNSLAAGAELFATGFEGEMLAELEASRTAPFDQHLGQWIELLLSLEPSGKQALAAAA